MCTAITVQTPQREVYFGRTMDFYYQLEPELYFIPKG
ncbi:linear amide C-N hydrolase, partial [Hungatella sp. SL.1.14]